jgi:hypothetical protein
VVLAVVLVVGLVLLDKLDEASRRHDSDGSRVSVAAQTTARCFLLTLPVAGHAVKRSLIGPSVIVGAGALISAAFF